MTYSLRTATHSEVGRVRKNNQDSGYASPTMLLVCDGMGGAAAGDLASAVAATEAARSDQRMGTAEDMLRAMSGIIVRVNNLLGELVANDVELDGMGTTFCGALFNGSQLGIAHVGDSRGYLLRDGELTQFTHDHSWVQQLIDEGRLTPEQAATHPHRSLILKVLNGQLECEPDFHTLDLELGDRILFCSDGLSGLIDDTAIQDLLALPDLDQATELLAEAAYVAGGYDNITVIVGEVVEQDDELDAAAGILVGSAVEVAIPRPGGMPRGSGDETEAASYPVHPPPGSEELNPDEVARYAPREAKRSGKGILASILVVVVLLGGASWGAVAYARSRYFIAPHEGNVAIYNGLPGSVLGYPLHTLTEDTDVVLTDLPPYFQRTVTNAIGVSGLDAARVTVEGLQVRAEQCVATREERMNAQTYTGPLLPSAPGVPLPPPASLSPEPYPSYLAPLPHDSADADPEAC